MDDLLEGIDNEIEFVLSQMHQLKDAQTEEYDKLFTKYDKLLKERTAIQSQMIDVEKSEKEMNFNAEESKKDRKNRIISGAISAVATIGAGALSVFGLILSIRSHERETEEVLEFEEKGTITTTMGRQVIGKTPTPKR